MKLFDTSKTSPISIRLETLEFRNLDSNHVRGKIQKLLRAKVTFHRLRIR